MSASSSGVSPRKSAALPTFHPFASKRFRFALSILGLLPVAVIYFQSSLARFDYGSRCLPCCLVKNLGDHDRVDVDSIEDPPSPIRVSDTKFVTPGTNVRHWTRVWHPQVFA